MLLEQVLSNKQSLQMVLEAEIRKVDQYLSNPHLMEAVGGFSPEDGAFVDRFKQAWKTKDSGVFINGTKKTSWSRNDTRRVYSWIKKMADWSPHPVLRLLVKLVIAAVAISYILFLISVGATGVAVAFFGLVEAIGSLSSGGVTIGLIQAYTGINIAMGAAGEAGSFVTGAKADLSGIKQDFINFKSFISRTFGRMRVVQVIQKVIGSAVTGIGSQLKRLRGSKEPEPKRLELLPES